MHVWHLICCCSFGTCCKALSFDRKKWMNECNRVNVINTQRKLLSLRRLDRITNVNGDQIYQYINQQITCTFRTHDQYRSWTLNKRHRQTAYNQTHAVHREHQSESQWRISMEFEWKYYGTKWKSDIGHTEWWKNSPLAVDGGTGGME